MDLRRRFCALVLLAMLTLAGPARAEGPVCVVAPGMAALVDEQGAERIAPGLHDEIFTVRENALFAAGSRGDYRLFDAEGQPLSDVHFAMIHDAGRCLLFRDGSLYGAMDDSGNILIEAAWTQLVPTDAGGYLALDGDPLDDEPDEIIRIDPSGETVRTGSRVVGGLSVPRDDRMPALASNGRYGAIDGQGTWAIAPVWRYIGPYENGMALARGEGGWGMIDGTGTERIAAEYDWMDRGASMIAGLKDWGVDVYDPDASGLLFRLEGEGLHVRLVGDCMAVSDDATSRLYGVDGTPRWEGACDADFYPGADGQVIVAEGEWGEPCQRLIDAGGVSSRAFQQLLPLCGGRYAWLSMRGAEYYSEDLDRLQRSWDYESARYGLADGEGNVLLDAVFLEIRALGRDRLLMRTEDEVLLTDVDGEVIRRWPAAGAEAPSSEAGA